ncbi:DUF1292 domain-containing protein [Peptoniphilus catoniae]|uniref:DUF1292 domain-containing protein n=1 Tax=Peptoniphilus catoniae TaxID=1660341 RepID=UPI0010FD84B2|nr:DUF1292 domain-containing protein [Peptoniphilus catoniae]
MNKQIFYDEEGNSAEFDIKAKFGIDDKYYVAMQRIDDEENLIYLLRIEIDDEGEEYLKGIDDEELKEAQEAYEELISEK